MNIVHTNVNTKQTNTVAPRVVEPEPEPEPIVEPKPEPEPIVKK